MAEHCPICKHDLVKSEDRGERLFFECPRCGCFSMSRTAYDTLGWRLNQRPDAGDKLSYALYRMTKREQWVMMDSELLGNIINNTELPRPQVQLENLISLIGDSLPAVGATVEVTNHILSAVGAKDMASVRVLLGHAQQSGYIEGQLTDFLSGDFAVNGLRLTLPGWSYYEELQRGQTSSRYAFIAMQFGRPDLDEVVNDCFRPAVAATGFELKRLDDSPSAGLIDDRLRVEIRQSRFLLADLTHHNKGAYWEAGFAEGLGKPVIYLCRKDVFEDKTQGTHFDTNHHLTVVWDPEDLKDAAEKLKATIRATLPNEAVFSD